MSPLSFYTVVIPKRLLLITIALSLLAVAVWRAYERRYPTPPPERIAQLMQAAPAAYVVTPATAPSPISEPGTPGAATASPLPSAPVAPNTPAVQLATPQALAVGQPAPEFSLPDLSDNLVSLSSFRGRPVIVYFWATWCHYCLESMPRLQSVRSQHKSAGLEVLAINILESPDRVRAHARRHGLSLPILLDREAQVTRAYLVRATPSYYFIDADGVLKHIAVGSLEPDALDHHLQAILPARQEETR